MCRYKILLRKTIVFLIILFLVYLYCFTYFLFAEEDFDCECTEDRILILQEPAMRGIDIELLQLRLIELEFFEGEVDGVYDLDVAKAVSNFQESKEMEVSGVVDFATWNALAEGFVTGNDKDKQGPGGEISIVINTYGRTLALYSDGELYKTYPVAIGKPSTKSPIGEWAIIQKSKDWGGGFGTRWLGLNVPWGIYGIHGTNKPWSIGRAASHGCFRMFNRDVEELFEWVPLKARVKVIGERLPIVVNRPLKPGQVGLEVMQLQDNLEAFGLNPGYKDARYGDTTEAAVRELQAQFGLEVNGIADWNVLFILDLPGEE
ncbi:L,D-transpeptidase family protein [Natronospora cellulosivora (SeqCode)]